MLKQDSVTDYERMNTIDASVSVTQYAPMIMTVVAFVCLAHTKLKLSHPCICCVGPYSPDARLHSNVTAA